MSKNVFDDKFLLVRYLLTVLNVPTPLKIQKAMYLLWAFYAASYGSASTGELDDEYPSQLFEPNFIAHQYGPLDKDLFTPYHYHQLDPKLKDDLLDNKFPVETLSLSALLTKSTLSLEEQTHNLSLFLDNLVSQIDAIDDWSLLNRTLQDNVFKNTRDQDLMKPDQIRQEYINKIR